MADQLTEKQEKFCQAYLLDFNASNAAREAGYSEGTAYAIGWENLRKPEIQARIAELRKDTANSLNITRERIAQELARIAFSDVTKVFAEDGSLKPISDWDEDTKAVIASVETDELFDGAGRDRTQVGLTRKVKSWEKVKALDSLVKLMGYAAPDKLDHTTNGQPIHPTVNINVVQPKEDDED